MKRLAIIGSGDLGRQIAYFAICDNSYSKVFFIDDFCLDKNINGIKVIGKIKDVTSLYNDNVFDEIIIGIGYKHLVKKSEIFLSFYNKIPFGKIIHSTCIIDKSSIIEDGCVLFPGSVIDANVVVQQNCLINISCSIAHDTIIGAHSFLSPRVAIAGFVSVGKLCVIGINSTIIDNIKIKDNVQIGGASLIIKNITKKGLYVGVPARFVR